jgi:hypothetical protein
VAVVSIEMNVFFLSKKAFMLSRELPSFLLCLVYVKVLSVQDATNLWPII